MAVRIEDGNVSETLTKDGGVFKSIGLEVSVGLERVADSEPEVVVDVGIIVILEGITVGGEEGLVVTAQGGDTVTGALDSPAAELRGGL